MKKNLFFLLALLPLMFSSCNEDMELSQEKIAPEIDYVSLISELGFDTTDIIDNGDYYVVEGDIMLRKEYLLQTTVSTRQARTPYIISDYTRHNIEIGVNEEVWSFPMGQFDWMEVIREAVAEWNSIGTGLMRIKVVHALPNSPIPYPGQSFNLRIRGAKINEITDSRVFGFADFPTPSGAPGPQIVINLGFVFANKATRSQVKYNIIHEIGHALGLRHTNWKGLGEGTPTNIIGTPTSGKNPDPNSVMNGGTASNSWKGFSKYDKFAIQLLYGKDTKMIDNLEVKRIFEVYNNNSHNSFDVLGSDDLYYFLHVKNGYSNRGLAAIHGYVLTKPNPKAQKLYRLWNRKSKNNFTVLGEADLHYWLNVEKSHKDREIEAEIGYAYPNQEPGTIPLYNVYNSNTKNDFTVAGDEALYYWLNTADDHRYRSAGEVFGYIYPYN